MNYTMIWEIVYSKYMQFVGNGLKHTKPLIGVLTVKKMWEMEARREMLSILQILVL